MWLIAVSGVRTASLAYDPLGRLWSAAGPGEDVRLVYDGDALVLEYAPGGGLLRRYVHGGGEDDPLLWYEGASLGDRRSLQADHQGSIVSVADAAGTAVAIERYDSWGRPARANRGRFQYTGQAWLKDAGLYHYKARAYSPDLGRFLQTDPVGYDDQINLYAYVGNDPVNARDPTGSETGSLFPSGGCTSGMFRCASTDPEGARAAANSVNSALKPNDIGRGGDGRILPKGHNNPPEIDQPEIINKFLVRSAGWLGLLQAILSIGGDSCRACNITLEGALKYPTSLCDMILSQFVHAVGTPKRGGIGQNVLGVLTLIRYEYYVK